MRNPRNEALAADITDAGSAERPGAPERSCILSRDRAPQAALIRLVLGPDGQVLPDVRAKAPGRGAWIGVTRAELAAAQAKGRLRGALQRAFRTQAITVPDDLPARIAAALERQALDRLGLESRAGTLLTGSDRIETAARSGQVRALFHAADARDDGCRKLAQAWRVGQDREGSDLRGLALPADRTILALALGRENVVHIALTDKAAARRVGEALGRWLHFIGSEPHGDGPPQAEAPDTAPCETASQGASAPASAQASIGDTGRDDDTRGF